PGGDRDVDVAAGLSVEAEEVIVEPVAAEQVAARPGRRLAALRRLDRRVLADPRVLRRVPAPGRRDAVARGEAAHGRDPAGVNHEVERILVGATVGEVAAR